MNSMNINVFILFIISVIVCCLLWNYCFNNAVYYCDIENPTATHWKLRFLFVFGVIWFSIMSLVNIFVIIEIGLRLLR